MIQVQATIVGYGGKPCTLFSAYDPDARVLVVSAETAYRADRRQDCLVISNDSAVPRDQLYTEEYQRDAIAAFYSLKHGVAADGQSARILFADRAARANPEQVIERDGYTESGARYRIAEGVTCAQVAALATCLYAVKADSVEQSVDMAEELRWLNYGDIITI